MKWIEELKCKVPHLGHRAQHWQTSACLVTKKGDGETSSSGKDKEHNAHARNIIGRKLRTAHQL
jgi:aminoglycoside phosphotransferase